MKELFIVRGLPGAGKTTLAKRLAAGAGSDYFEADHYFYDEEGNYIFDKSNLHKAHESCINLVEKAMSTGQYGMFSEYRIPLQRIVVSNTFTTEKEMYPYYDLAKKYGYYVFSIIVENRHGNESIHDVPEEAIQRMEDRFNIKLR